MAQSKWQKENKDKINAYRREYRKTHRDELNAKKRRYVETHREEIGEKKRIWYANRSEENKNVERAWARAHAKKRNEYSSLYRMKYSDEIHENANRKWHLTRFQLVSAHGGHCVICGYDRNIKALEFHHINPSEKEGKVKSLAESNKCILICSNCHREHHYGGLEYREISENPKLIKKLEEAYLRLYIGSASEARATLERIEEVDRKL